MICELLFKTDKEMVELYCPIAGFYAELFSRMNTKCLLCKMFNNKRTTIF